MAFRFYLDGQLTDQPMNDMELSTTIKRNSSLGALLITQDVELSYNGNNDPEPLEISGYSYLKGKFDTGSCQEVAIRIIDNSDPTQTIEIYNGVIKVPSIRFDLQRVVAKCKVQDNSFYAYINNNKSIKYDIQSPTTKNGVLISPPPAYDVDVFLGCDGTALLTPAKGYRVYDVFQYLVSAISDNKVAFYSNFLQTEPEVFIFDGFALQNQGATPSVKTSFGALFNEMNKIFNLSFYIDNTDPTNPTMIMEKTSDLFSGLNQVEFLDIKDLQSNIREDNLYGTVKAGSDYNPIGSDQVYTIPGVSYYSFGEEIFTPKGQCNIDNELDLVNQFKISNNAVNDQINGGVIESIPTTAILGNTLNSNFLNVTPARYYYNPNLNNQNISIRYLSDISNSIANYYLNSNDGEVLAYLNTNINNAYVPADNQGFLVNEAYDFGNYYDTVLARYVTPINGVFTFTSKITLQLGAISNPFGVATPNNWYQVWLEHYNASNVIINRYEYYTPNLILTPNTIPPGGIFDRIFEYVGAVNSTYAFNLPNTAVSMNPGDYVTVRFRSYPYTWPILTPPLFVAGQQYTILNGQNNTYLQCVDNSNVGAVFLDVEPDDFKVQLHRFNYPMSQSEFDVILANPTGRIQFAMEGQQPRFGWIKQMKYNHTTATAEFVLTTSKATQNGGS